MCFQKLPSWRIHWGDKKTNAILRSPTVLPSQLGPWNKLNTLTNILHQCQLNQLRCLSTVPHPWGQFQAACALNLRVHMFIPPIPPSTAWGNVSLRQKRWVCRNVREEEIGRRGRRRCGRRGQWRQIQKRGWRRWEEQKQEEQKEAKLGGRKKATYEERNGEEREIRSKRWWRRRPTNGR